MRATWVRSVFVALALVVGLAACSAARPGEGPATSAPEGVRNSFARDLEASAEAWNRGDLDGFLATYLNSSQTTFVGRNGLIRGLDAIRQMYQQSYWQQGGPRELLGFRDLEVRPLGATHALATGRYVLTDRRTGAATATGIFSLVLQRTAEGWRILHDQSS